MALWESLCSFNKQLVLLVLSENDALQKLDHLKRFTSKLNRKLEERLARAKNENENEKAEKKRSVSLFLNTKSP